MQGTCLQKVIIVMIAALFASGLIEFYKNFIQRADREINQDWRPHPAASATP